MENINTKAIDDNSGIVSKFIKLSPDSISKINKEENLVKKIDQDICEITEKISEKMLRINYLDSALKRRNRDVSNEKEQRDLYMILDELNAMIKAANGEWFGEKLDKNSLNYLKLHGSKNLVEEKQILRDIKIQQKEKDLASFKSSSHLFDSSSFAFSMIKEIEQLRIQHLERASGNDLVIGNVSKYESLKKRLEDQIKFLRDDTLRNRECIEYCGTRVRQDVKELEASIREIYSLIAKLREKQKKKDEAYPRILKLKNLYNEEILQYCQLLINRVHKLGEEKDVAALNEMSNSEVGRFMLELYNDKAFREIYVRSVLLSLERRRQPSRDESKKPIIYHAVELEIVRINAIQLKFQ